MTPFVVHLQSATQYERIEQATAFIGEDASGSFGILAGHQRMMTVLVFGLARLQTAGDWQWIALPGGLLYFMGNELFLNTRRYLRDRDCARIAAALDEQLRGEEASLHDIKDSFRRLEEEMFKRLWRLGRSRETFS